MVERIGRTRRYQSTPAGLKAIAALVVLREKAICPLVVDTYDLNGHAVAPELHAQVSGKRITAD